MISVIDREGRLRPFAEIEIDVFYAAVKHENGHATRAAESLGVSKTDLYRKLGVTRIKMARIASRIDNGA